MINRKKQKILIIKLITLISLIALIIRIPKLNLFYHTHNAIEINEDLIDFEGFDNENGTSEPIIPNIVHLLYLQQPYIKFYQLVNILSIYFNHKPDFIYIHCDDCSFRRDKYFEILKNYKDIWQIIKIYKIPFKTTVFNKTYKWINHHRSDVWRLQLLMNYGGIYLDNDVYVVRNLNEYLKYEMVVSWDEPIELNGIGVQVYIAHRNARLLKAHFDSYRYDYNESSWFYNAGHVPARILSEYSYLAKKVRFKLGTWVHYVEELFQMNNWNNWKNFNTIHLMINHRYYMDKDAAAIKEFDETNIWTFNKTYGTMARILLRKANLLLPINNDQSIIID